MGSLRLFLAAEVPNEALFGREIKVVDSTSRRLVAVSVPGTQQRLEQTPGPFGRSVEVDGTVGLEVRTGLSPRIVAGDRHG